MADKDGVEEQDDYAVMTMMVMMMVKKLLMTGFEDPSKKNKMNKQTGTARSNELKTANRARPVAPFLQTASST